MTTPSIQKKIADLQQQIDQTGKAIDAASLRQAYPHLTPQLTRFLEAHSLTAAAAKGRISIKQIDDALAGTNMTTVGKIEAKLKLAAAGVLSLLA